VRWQGHKLPSYFRYVSLAPALYLLIQCLQTRRVLDPEIIPYLNLYAVQITRACPIYGKHVNRELRGARLKVDIGHRQRLSQQFRHGIHRTSFLLAKRQGSPLTLAYHWHTLPLSSPIEDVSFSPGLESIRSHAQSLGKLVIHFLVTVRNVRFHAQEFP
jgi:hypothetical protein